ncbi:hypothetical protein O1611_g2640 [Lasiodiplodia mahajangana]|uniref:Uncharacterized protein n=1 Tax=Lasiodiplodia mahajangana TaxID=1108764 RepID=A0ACC2JTY5_9PEZI|nr:hypothetical protein O1611_g2640 [Lasiodiplodia mahajangana]
MSPKRVRAQASAEEGPVREDVRFLNVFSAIWMKRKRPIFGRHDISRKIAKVSVSCTPSNRPQALPAFNDQNLTKLLTDAATTPIEENENLWEMAYEELKAAPDTKNIVETHEKIMSLQVERLRTSSIEVQGLANNIFNLSEVENTFEKFNAAERKDWMQKIAKDGLSRAEHITGGEKAVLAAVRFVKSCRASVSSALSSSLAASIAWVGVCTILPLLGNPIYQRLEHSMLLTYVLDQAEWYSKLSKTFARRPHLVADHIADSEGLHRDLQRKIIDIFKLLIRANMISVCRYYHKNNIVVMLRDSIVWDNWADMLKTIKMAEEVFRVRSKQYYNNTVAKSLDSIDKHMQHESRRERCNELLNLWSNYQTHRTETDPREILDGTGDWFFKHPHFVAWSQWTSDGGLLVLKTDPGCGKSVLAAEVIKRLEEEGTYTVAYFFFKKASGDNTAVDVLTAILHQLLSRHEELLDRSVKCGTSISDYMRRNSKAPPERMVGVLWDILEAATSPSKDHAVNMVCVLDGIDACDAHADLFCKRLQNYLAGNHQRIKFLITSRWSASSFSEEKVLFEHIATCSMIDVAKIEGSDDGKDDETRLRDEIIRENRRQDIDRVIEHGIKTLTNDDDESTQLRRLLQTGPQRTFLWVCLVFKYLRVEKSKIDTSPRSWIDRITQNDKISGPTQLPKDVDDAYEQLLRETEQHWSNREQLAAIFKIVAAAKRPLTLHELRIACAIQDVEQTKHNLKLEKATDIRRLHAMASQPTDMIEFRETIQQKCGFFLELDHLDRVTFFHETAREFLITTDKVPAHGSWKCSVDMTEAHIILARTCTLAIILRLIDISAGWYPMLSKIPMTEVATGRTATRPSLPTTLSNYFFIKSRGADISANLHTLCTNLLEQSETLLAHKALYLSASATVDAFPSLMAVGLAELAVHVIPRNNIDYGKRFALLADCYFSRFEILGNPEDLERAAGLFYDAKKEDFGEEDGEELARRIDKFAESQLQRYKFTGIEKDLDSAISLKWDAIGFTDRYSPNCDIRIAEARLFECEKPSNSENVLFMEDVEAWMADIEIWDVSNELRELLRELRRRVVSMRTAMEGNKVISRTPPF